LLCPNSTTNSCTITVPAGQRFVIEQFSALQYFTTGSLGYVNAIALTNGQVLQNYFTPTTPTNIGVISSVIPATPTRIYADPGSTLTFYFLEVAGSQAGIQGAGG